MTPNPANIRCVGGPLDGQWWPSDKGAPVIPVPLAGGIMTGMDSGASVPTVQYRERQLRFQDGTWHPFFVPDDWSFQRLVDHLNLVAPNGLSESQEEKKA